MLFILKLEVNKLSEKLLTEMQDSTEEEFKIDDKMQECQDFLLVEQELKKTLDEIESLKREESRRIFRQFSNLQLNKKNYKHAKTLLKHIFGKKMSEILLAELVKSREVNIFN